MKLYKISVKDHGYYWCYTEFVVLGNSINDMLENLYKELFPDATDIPFYLRSSNFDIINLGEFIPDEKVKYKLNKIICYKYLSED